jgi:hypothetical protein
MAKRRVYRQRRLKLLRRAILAAGFIAAATIFFIANAEPENPLGYDPMDTKAFQHDLAVFGGNATVISAQFTDWFVGLWHGKNLAYTIAVLSVLIVLAIRYVAVRLPPDPIDDGSDRVVPFEPRP